MSKKKIPKTPIPKEPEQPTDECGFALGDAQIRIAELDEIIHDLLEENLRLKKDIKSERSISEYYSQYSKIRWHKEELSSCPFCGSTQTRFVTIPCIKTDNVMGVIQCRECRAQGGQAFQETSDCDIDELKEEAAKLWNVRCFDGYYAGSRGD